MAISTEVIWLIDQKLATLIRSGCRIDQIKMVCAAGTELVKQGSVETGFGKLRIEPSNFVPQGKYRRSVQRIYMGTKFKRQGEEAQ